MESRSLLKKYDIPISHLDFDYIGKCTDTKELERIVMILRSGEEGFYPDLTKCAEEKLKNLKPESRVLRKEERVRTKNNFSREEWEQHNAPIIEWSAEIKNKDTILSTIQESYESFDDLPPIRKSSRMGTMKEKSTDPMTKSSINKGTSRPAAPSTNYREWDKYDADAEILKMELEDERTKEHVERMNKINKELSIKMKDCDNGKTCLYSKLNAIEKEKLAEDYKIRGNECFKSKEYTEALEHYSRCIQILPTVPGYNNRAITNIKLQRYTDAISDCENCLKREPNNVKALLRKALAFLELGKNIDAYQSYARVLSIDSNNTTACKELERLRKELGEVAPVHATRIKIAENESVGGEENKLANLRPKPNIASPPPTVDYDLAELVKPNRLVKSKLAKTMENLSKVTTNKDVMANPSAVEKIPNLKNKEYKSKFGLLVGDSSSKGREEKLLIQEL